MAIDMIENSPLPAAMQLNPGNAKHFSGDFSDLAEKTDGDYADATGISLFGNVYELLKKKKQKERDISETAVMAAVNKNYPIPIKDCTAISDARQKIAAEILNINNQIVAGDNPKTKKDWLNALNGRDTILKKMQTDLKCVEQIEEAELNKNKQDILKALNEAGGSNIPSSTFDKTSKYFIWGAVGVMVLGAVVILLKKKKAGNASSS